MGFLYKPSSSNRIPTRSSYLNSSFYFHLNPCHRMMFPKIFKEHYVGKGLRNGWHLTSQLGATTLNGITMRNWWKWAKIHSRPISNTPWALQELLAPQANLPPGLQLQTPQGLGISYTYPLTCQQSYLSASGATTNIITEAVIFSCMLNWQMPQRYMPEHMRDSPNIHK